MSDDSSTKRFVLRVGIPVVVVAAVIGIMAGTIVRQSREAGASELVLEPVASVGNDPFTMPIVPGSAGSAGFDPDVELGPDDIELMSMVTEQLNPPVGDLPEIDFTGIELPEVDDGDLVNVSGAAPGLYGGTNVLEVCDKDQLVAFLVENEDKAAAWADVHGIAAADIPAFVAGLTDVILQVDTRVTNHGFRDGKANPIDSVLQAGTAVLIDADGVPRVRCYCGNPLLEPRSLGTQDPTFRGEAWDGFDLDDTVVISAGEPIDELVLDDISTDNFVLRAPGSELDTARVVDPVGQPVLPDADPPSPTQPEPTVVPEPTAPPTATPAPTAAPTPTPTPRAPAVDLTGTGSVSASSTFNADFVASLAVDGSRGSSWFSAGGGGASLTWSGRQRVFIETVDILSNASHQTVDFRTGFGFESVTVSVSDGGVTVFSETYGLPGTPDPDVRASPGVVGDTILLEFSGGEDPTCGGFSELVVTGSPA